MPLPFLHQLLDHVFVGIPILPILLSNRGCIRFHFFTTFYQFLIVINLWSKNLLSSICVLVFCFLLKQKSLLLFLSFFLNYRSFAKRIFRGELVFWSHRESKHKFRLVSFLREIKNEIFFWIRLFMKQLDSEKRSSQCWPGEERFSSRHTLETEKQKQKSKTKQKSLNDYPGVSKKRFVNLAKVKISLSTIIVRKIEKNWRKMKKVWHRCTS